MWCPGMSCEGPLQALGAAYASLAARDFGGLAGGGAAAARLSSLPRSTAAFAPPEAQVKRCHLLSGYDFICVMPPPRPGRCTKCSSRACRQALQHWRARTGARCQ